MKVSQKMIYVGGDTQTLTYDFFTKVANSTAECPLKLYKGAVDPNNIPAPTDPTWAEITDQRAIDKLKVQNELPISNVNLSAKTAQFNGQNLVLQGSAITPPQGSQWGSTAKAIYDDFIGKTAGDTNGNPNIISRVNNRATFLTPSDVIPANEISQGGYDGAKTPSDSGTTAPAQNLATTAGAYAQLLFSFNLISALETKYGQLPCPNDTASKVQWLKDNLSKITCNWYGYGVANGVNKAYFLPYDTIYVGGWKTQYQVSNTATSSSKLSIDISNSGGFTLSNGITTDGFVHFLAYTDAVATNTNAIYLTGHGLVQWDIIFNTTRNILKDISSVQGNLLTLSSAISGQTSGDTIKKYHSNGTTKTTETGTNGSTIVITNHGLTTGDVVGISGYGYSSITVVNANTFTLNQSIGSIVVGKTVYYTTYIGTQTAEKSSSTIYTDYISIDAELKANAGYDLLVPENPRRDAGLGDIVEVNKDYAKITDDFNGKTVSNTTVPHIAYTTLTNSGLKTPNDITNDGSTGWEEASNTLYGYIKQSGDTPLWQSLRTTSGQYAQQMFSFNLIRQFEDMYGQMPCSQDTASKVAWLRTAIKQVIVKWYGYGTCPSGNKANLQFWSSSSSWSGTQTHAYINSNTALSYTFNTFSDRNHITSEGFLHFIASTDASNGSIPSVINSDYISLDMEFNPRLYTNQSDDFVGKQAGSTVAVPHIANWNNSTQALQSPTTNGVWSEVGTSGTTYSQLNAYDGNPCAVGVTANGYLSQQLFSFNLIRLFEDQYGMIPTANTTAGKVAWLKSNITKITCNWYGYGTCPTTSADFTANGINFKAATQGKMAMLTDWNVGASKWGTQMDVSYGAFTLNGSPIQVTKALSTSTNLTTDGFVHMLAYTNPSDVTTASTIFTDYVQIVVEYKAIDSVEYFTSNSVEIEVKQLNKASAYLVEVDMNAVCTALYGGNNTNLKNALNSISVDAWVMGQGSDGGNLRNNVRIMAWRASDSTYAYSYIAENITPNVTKCTIPSSTPTDYIGWSKDRVTSNNKIYILAHSLYTSDTFIPSEVNLDYINVRVDLSGQPDVVQSIPLTLPDTWSMIVKGWSPSYPYDSYSSGYSSIVQLYRDSNNYLHLAYDKSSKNFYFHAVQRGINTHLMQTVKSTTFSKYQCTNFAVVTNSANTIIYALENGEPIASVSLAKFNTLGVFQLYFGSHQSGNYQADAFLQSLQFYPNKIFSDTDAEAMLRSMPELIDLSKATLYNGATYSNGIITHTNSTSGSQLAFIMVIPVLPNNNYVITCDDLTNGYIDVIERYNNVSISNHWGYVTPTTKTNSVIVTDKTNNLYVMVVNGNNQTSSYSKLSVKIKM